MKKIFLIAFLIVTTTTIFAQPPHKRKENLEQIKTQKIAFITEKLSLTSQEAQVFWPVYNEFEKKRDEIQNKRRSIMKKIRFNSETLSDVELEQIAQQFISTQVDIGKLHEEYHTKFKKVITIKKVVKLYQIEQEFKRELLKQISEEGGTTN
jgi:hypothetical protein